MQYDVVHRGFIYDGAPTAMCHASTVLPLSEDRVLAAWFAGTHEGEADVGIWYAVRTGKVWSAPRLIMQGVAPHWNPVLLDLKDGRIALFYKVGADISKWRTMISYSADKGENWSEAHELVPGDEGGRGPARCKVIRLSGGRLLAPGSQESGIWESFADLSDDNGITWTKSNAVRIEDLQYQQGDRTVSHTDIAVSEQSYFGRGVIQPTLWQSENGVHMMMRSTQGRIYRSDSWDEGVRWCSAYETMLPNNNSGIDVVRLEGGTLVLAYNPVGETWGPRTPMSLAVSADNGTTWERLFDLDSGDGEFSYPAVTVCGNILHITYTWKRQTIAYWQINIKERG